MDIAFRCDASLDIGSGHVMRCLTLAKALRRDGHRCWFICRDLSSHMGEVIVRSEFPVTLLRKPSNKFVPDSRSPVHAHWAGVSWEVDAKETQQALPSRCDWLVVDHYAFDVRWENAIRSAVKQVLVIDDLADRAHDADILLDQSIGRVVSDYHGLVSSAALSLIGPQYAILRPEFLSLRSKGLKHRYELRLPLRHLLIFMGGIDLQNITGKILECLNAKVFGMLEQVTVVMGALAPALEHVRSIAARLPIPTSVLVGTEDMADLMYHADLAIGGVGGTTLERCCLGLPTLLVIMAENQQLMAKKLQENGAGCVVADISQNQAIGANNFDLENVFSSLTSDQIQKMAIACSSVTDGRGTQRVLTAMSVINRGQSPY